MELPNLNGLADPENVSQKGTGTFNASYINWGRTLHDVRSKAPGWMPEMALDIDGNQVHKAPDGSCYLVIRFTHIDGTMTAGIPHAIMDNRMQPIAGDKIGSRDVADSFVRGACKAAAALFGYAWQLWSKDDPLERTQEEDDEAEKLREARAEERKNIKVGKILQSQALSEEEIKYVGDDITDQHSTPQGWLEENDPIAVQEEKSWKDVICDYKKHKGKTVGQIMEEDPTYLDYFSDKTDSMNNREFAEALMMYAKSKNQDGNQGFGRVA